ncbi:MAG: hypothetical protein AAF502_17245 [Bacteroidota bacterium]
MEIAITIFVIIIISGILLKGVSKSRNAAESKLGIYEHPATYEKQPIEMVDDALIDDNDIDASDNSLP